MACRGVLALLALAAFNIFPARKRVLAGHLQGQRALWFAG